MDTTSRELEHIEVFKCPNYAKRGKVSKQSPIIYCFSLVNNQGDICFSSFEDKKLDTGYLERLCRRAAIMFGETSLENIPIYTNVPRIHHSPDTEILNAEELETITDYLSPR